MNMHKTLILFFVIAVTVASGQGMLIGNVTRNGSFEDGIALPWGGVTVFQGSLFASQGSWYAGVQAIGNGSQARTDSFQDFIPAYPNAGRTFNVTFDARIGLAGFDSVGGFASAWNGDGAFVLPTVTSIATPPLSPGGWVNYQYRFDFPAIWDGGGSFRFEILFHKNGALTGTTYTGYLDNIVLQQIPEPSSLALCLTGGILAARRLIRRCKT